MAVRLLWFAVVCAVCAATPLMVEGPGLLDSVKMESGNGVLEAGKAAQMSATKVQTKIEQSTPTFTVKITEGEDKDKENLKDNEKIAAPKLKEVDAGALTKKVTTPEQKAEVASAKSESNRNEESNTVKSKSNPSPATNQQNPDSKKDLAQQSDDAMVDIIVVIPTVRRYQKNGDPAPERYLQPMVNKLIHDMSPKERTHVKFFILNSDSEPEKHVEAEDLGKLPGVTIFHKHSSHDEIVQAVSDSDKLEDGRQVSTEWLSWVASENADGAFLLEKARTQAPYVLFLEDDVWPTTNALAKLSKIINTFDKDDWLFLNLYTPNLDWGEGMLTFKSGEKYPFMCCTQAMLFRSDRVSGVIHYWLEHVREPVDDNLRNYILKEAPDLNIYGIRPNLFEHVGAYSSNKIKSTGVVEHTSLEFVPLLIQAESETHKTK